MAHEWQHWVSNPAASAYEVWGPGGGIGGGAGYGYVGGGAGTGTPANGNGNGAAATPGGSCPAPPGPRYYIYDRKDNCFRPRRRKRRTALVTNAEISALIKLKGVFGKGDGLKTWIATHSK